jgi:hypothetical protein
MVRPYAVALALVSLCVGAGAHGAPPAGRSGSLILQSSTPGADIFVDGEKVGVVPLSAPITLQAGDHTIKVLKIGYAPLIDVFHIEKHKVTRLDVELVPVSGVLKVTSNVEKAKVFVDGKFVGEVPLTAEIPVGAAAVQVSRGGYKDFFQNISSVAGQEVALEVQLEELPFGVNPYKPVPPPPRRWFEKWWVWTVGAVAVGAVVTVVVVPIFTVCRDPVKCFGPDRVYSGTVPPPP